MLPSAFRVAPVLLAGALFFAALVPLADAAFPQYSYLDHPLHDFPEFTTTPPVPVIMSSYKMMHATNGPRTGGMRFMPGVGTYKDAVTDAPFSTGLDALVAPKFKSGLEKDGVFLSAKLNGPARVLVLLVGKEIRPKFLSASPSVSGLGGWSGTRILVNKAYKQSLPGISRPNRLPVFAVSLEKEFALNETVTVPPLDTIKIDETIVPTKVVLLFAQPGGSAAGTLPVAFPAPTLPAASIVAKFVPGTTALTTPEPNQRCPAWLHDVHVVKSHDMGVGGPEYWKTWHPQIDSVYWCYFGHEHGSYPGHYRPPLGYTAYKTKDETTSHGRQNESHNGFKMFSFMDKGVAYIATVHMHMSKARRFTTRHHTMIFAAFKVSADSKWSKKLELFMKMDFGPTTFTRKSNKTTALASQADIKAEIEGKKEKRMRRVNVINATLTDETLNEDPIRKKVYEQWTGALNTCSKSVKGKRNVGMSFDVRNAPTGLKDIVGETTDADMPYFKRRGGLNRVVAIRRGGLRIARDLCNFEGTFAPAANGTFFTDSFFSKIEPGSAEFTLHQFMAPDFTEITISQGLLFPKGFWNTEMGYGKDENVKGRILEGAVDRTEN